MRSKQKSLLVKWFRPERVVFNGNKGWANKQHPLFSLITKAFRIQLVKSK